MRHRDTTSPPSPERMTDMSADIHRRTVLKIIAAASAQGLMWGLFPSPARSDEPSRREALRHALREIFPDHRHALSVGRRYLHQDATASLSLRRVDEWLGPYIHDASRIAAVIRDRRASDFARRDSIVIDGWVLARCEADLCAAMLLLQAG